MARTFNIVVEHDEDGWFVSDVVELTGCHTQGKTLDELLLSTKEAISLRIKCKKHVEANGKFVGL